MIQPTWQSDDGSVQLYLGDCMEVLPTLGTYDAAVTDPPYGETSLDWDKAVAGWQELLHTNSLWCYGSMRYFLQSISQFSNWKFAQDLVWEKHNGSGLHSDRFRRVHELLLHFYRDEWNAIYKCPQFTNDATARAVRRKTRPAHWNDIGKGSYRSVDGGPRLVRSVLFAPSSHGNALHRTQKPIDITQHVCAYSCPIGGTIVDPFMGSATTAIACINLGINFTGMELIPEHFSVALRRIVKHLKAVKQSLFREQTEAEIQQQKQASLFEESP